MRDDGSPINATAIAIENRSSPPMPGPCGPSAASGPRWARSTKEPNPAASPMDSSRIPYSRRA